ncbi:hypothetical protein Fuma_06232 [Fuerstiella marisgermanici]|uniref:Uncharacterized protein n=1 Tax=Fuerstiella marisgermanici TaxID=1891926 RepID=A0A1P8WR82_9PLAN|nr:hypothetical protein Fuma_06232 [Fuerstiella marisgermanici]
MPARSIRRFKVNRLAAAEGQGNGWNYFLKDVSNLPGTEAIGYYADGEAALHASLPMHHSLRFPFKLSGNPPPSGVNTSCPALCC